MKLKTLAKLTLTVLAAAALCLAVSAKEPVSVGKPVTVSSFQSGNIAANINDGDDDTRWCASDSVYPQEIVIDLEGWYDLSDADIYFHRPDWDKDRHYSFKLFGSSDGESYSLLDGGDFSANESAERRLVFTLGGTARYVKLEMYSCSSSSGWASVSEMTLYGTPGGEQRRNGWRRRRRFPGSYGRFRAQAVFIAFSPRKSLRQALERSNSRSRAFVGFVGIRPRKIGRAGSHGDLHGTSGRRGSGRNIGDEKSLCQKQ